MKISQFLSKKKEESFALFLSFTMKHSFTESSSQSELDSVEAIFIENPYERFALIGIHD
jgi:hypothetical protein